MLYRRSIPRSWVGVAAAAAVCVPGIVMAQSSESTLLDRIKGKAAEIQPQLVEVRRQIHMHPELSGQEEKTAALVAARLRELGMDVETGVGGHGVVGVLRGGKAGPVVAYRADMDAVPSPVVGDPPYKSRVAGVKHVCGHDAHVAVGLGVAGVLAAIREDLPGVVKFLFQPAEENVQGAQAMIAAGVLDDPAPEAIFAVHTAPMPVGFMGAPPGVGLTGWQPFEIRLRATSELDALSRAVRQSLESLSTVPGLMNPTEISSLLNDMTVENGPLSDFILVTGINSSRQAPEHSVISGMVRAAGTEHYDRARRSIRAELEQVTGGKAEFELEFGERFPDMHSDSKLVHAAIPPIESAIGTGRIILIRASAPYFGEDFALYQQSIPGAMFFLGVANPEKGIGAFNHSPDYDLDEDAIELGTVAMANVLLDYLQRHQE